MARKKKEGRFKYKKRSKESVQKRASQQGGMYDSCYRQDLKVWVPKPGDQVFRVLPPTWDDAEHYAIDAWIHSSVGPDNQSYLCLEKMKGERCPVCEAIKDATRRGDGDEEWVGSVKPYRRVLAWIIVRGEEKEGPQLYPMPWTMDRDLTKHMIDKTTGDILEVDDPEDGYDCEFEREGTGMKTKYVAIAVARRSSPLSDDEDEAQEWLEFVMQNPLPDVLNYYSYDHIEKVFGAAEPAPVDDDDDDDDDDDGPPVRTRKRRGRDDDEDEDDEDDDEPAPKRKKKKGKKVKEVLEEIDDEDEELDDDDDDEDDQPKKKKRKKDKKKKSK